MCWDTGDRRVFSLRKSRGKEEEGGGERRVAGQGTGRKETKKEEKTVMEDSHNRCLKITIGFLSGDWIFKTIQLHTRLIYLYNFRKGSAEVCEKIWDKGQLDGKLL